VDGVNFKKFTKLNSFHKPNDQRNINLMNACAKEIFTRHKHDILCAYGFSDEYNFAIKKSSLIYDRKHK